MKKKLLLIFTVAFAACLGLAALTGCSDDNNASSDVDIDTLKVGFDAGGYEPYGYMGEKGEYTGFDLDLAAEVCKRNGWEFEAVPVDWDSKDAQLDSGNIDCIWNGFSVTGREDKYAFTEPYMLNSQVVVVKADSGIATLADLKDKVVVTQLDSTGEEVLKNDQAELAKTFARLDTIADYPNAFMQLEAGNVDAVVCDASFAAYAMAQKEGTFTQLEEVVADDKYAVGCKLGNDALAQKITETLKEMDKDGFVKELIETPKYADQQMSYSLWLLKA